MDLCKLSNRPAHSQRRQRPANREFGPHLRPARHSSSQPNTSRLIQSIAKFRVVDVLLGRMSVNLTLRLIATESRNNYGANATRNSMMLAAA